MILLSSVIFSTATHISVASSFTSFTRHFHTTSVCSTSVISLSTSQHNNTQSLSINRSINLPTIIMSERLSPLILSDLEQEQADRQGQESAAAHVLATVGDLLVTADAQLEQLEQDDILSTAIYRGSQELAAAVGHLAHQLEQQTQEDQRALAAACLRDVQEHCLYLHEQQDNDNNNNNLEYENQALVMQNKELAHMNEHDFVQVLQGAAVFLRDVEASLQALEPDEAEEVADVALTVGRLFVASLQSIHEQLVPQDLLESLNQHQQQSSSSNNERSTVTIELLEDEDDDEDEEENTASKTSNTASSAPRSQGNTPRSQTKQRRDRLRVLWPPLGPQVQKACQWGQKTAMQQPLLAVALGFTLWPAAVFSAFIGTPVLVADHLMQDFYNHFQDGPLIQNLERGAAQIYQTGRLALVSGKLVTRQSLRVAKRQIDRNGGLPQVAQHIMAFGVDRITHPVETVGILWDGLCWAKDRVCETIDHFRHEERDPKVIQLQQ